MPQQFSHQPPPVETVTDTDSGVGCGSGFEAADIQPPTPLRREPEPSADADVAGVAEEIEALRAAVDELTAEYTSTTNSSPPAPDESAFEWVEEPEPPRAVRLLAERVTSLETQLVAVAQQLAGPAVSELETAVDRQQAAYELLDETLEADLDGIETVLEALLDRTETLRERLDVVEKRRTAERESLERRLDAERALRSLIQEALRHGISAAACQHCGQSVDIELLEQPVCPACERRFTGIESDGWSLFSTPTLVAGGRHSPASPRGPPAGDR